MKLESVDVKHAPKAPKPRREKLRCADCGEVGERTGHMTCQYPQDRE